MKYEKKKIFYEKFYKGCVFLYNNEEYIEKNKTKTF